MDRALVKRILTWNLWNHVMSFSIEFLQTCKFKKNGIVYSFDWLEFLSKIGISRIGVKLWFFISFLLIPANKSVLSWFKEYQLYQIALVYMSTRFFVNLSQVVTMWIQKNWVLYQITWLKKNYKFIWKNK